MNNELSAEEIAAILDEVKQRVRARHASGSVPGASDASFNTPVANLLPLLHARDAAQSKVASIGSVNPRAGGLANRLIQTGKRTIARALAWFVRDQITFNRSVLSYFEASLEVLNEINAGMRSMSAAAVQMNDLRTFWDQWRLEWENSLRKNEFTLMRGLADLQNDFARRVSSAEILSRDIAKSHHAAFEGALERTNLDIQKRIWTDFEKIRTEFDRLIHIELRMIRQRAQVGIAGSAAPLTTPSPSSLFTHFDYARFAERFRGSEEYVRRNQQFYLPFFEQSLEVLDIGCGRGEFLEMLRSYQVHARGIELSPESVALCRDKGLEVKQADLFEYLAALPPESESAIFSAQVVEHIDAARLPEMVRLCASRLGRGGVLEHGHQSRVK